VIAVVQVCSFYCCRSHSFLFCLLVSSENKYVFILQYLLSM
jgi:hypothetical protein